MGRNDYCAVAFALSAAVLLCAFPAPAASDASLAMPRGASFEFGPDGNFLVAGRPRFLIGNLYYGGYGASSLVKGPGYGEGDAWIYESMPDRAYLQRLGFDTSGGESSPTWQAKYRDPRRFYQARRGIDWGVAQAYWGSGLPMVVDFTCATWSHGGMKYEKGKKPDERAFVDKCHFIYYSLVTPEGRELWRELWRSGAEELKEHGARPYVYELFNEPSYDDRSPAGRAAFAKFLSNIWKGDASAMDRAWNTSYGSFESASGFKDTNEAMGLAVAWHKFREECFRSGVRLGIATIRDVDPVARFCFQPLSHLHNIVLVAGAYGLCEVAMMPTGGGSLYADIAIRALSDGKPMIDGETYLGRTRTTHRAKLVQEWARGLNASYYFKWERRLNELDKSNPEESLRRLGERFPWLGLNPAFVAPAELVGIMEAKRDIFAMQDLFAPRGRGLPDAKKVATLFSMPTYRVPASSARRCSAYAETCAMAIAEDAHLPLDAVFEEQLEKGRLDRYRLLVASGVDATYDATPGHLENWVRDGGTLVLAQEAMGLDEWGGERAKAPFPGITLGENAQGDTSRFAFLGSEYEAVAYRKASFGPEWETLASLPGGHPAVARRRSGRGAVYYIGVRFPRRGDEGRLIASIAAPLGILPTCRTLDYATGEPVDGIEVHAARLPSGDTGFVAMNTGLATKAVRFVPGQDFASGELIDIRTRTVLGRDAEGAAVLVLAPSDPVVLRGAPSVKRLAEALADAPAPSASHSGEFTRDTYDAAFARIPELLAKGGSSATVVPFPVDPARMSTLDLREAANATLGKMLKNPPWGTTVCAGVPFDFIRPDQNGDRSAIALGPASAKKPSIAANVRAGALYFLHTGDGAKCGCAIKYNVRYADGSSVEYRAEAFGDFGRLEVAVPSPMPESLECSPGWADSMRKGLWVSKWANPCPEKTITSVDVSSEGDFTAVVAAISSEAPPQGFAAFPVRNRPKFRPWGGAKAEWSDSLGGFSLDLSGVKGWPGVNADWKDLPIPPSDGVEMNADLEFDVVTDGSPLPILQVRIGKGRYHVLEPFLRKTGDGRWRASIPFEYAKPGESGLGFQRRGDSAAGAASKVSFCGFRVANRGHGVAENPLELRRFDPEATEGAKALWRDGGLELAVANNNRHWSSLQLRLAEPLPLDDDMKKSELVFEVNSGRTPLGVPGTGRQRIRGWMALKMTGGKEEQRPSLGKARIDGGKIDDDPWTWQTVRMPLPENIASAASLHRIVIGLVDMPQDGRSGIVVRNLRFEKATR